MADFDQLHTLNTGYGVSSSSSHTDGDGGDKEVEAEHLIERFSAWVLRFLFSHNASCFSCLLPFLLLPNFTFPSALTPEDTDSHGGLDLEDTDKAFPLKLCFTYQVCEERTGAQFAVPP